MKKQLWLKEIKFQKLSYLFNNENTFFKNEQFGNVITDITADF